MIAGSVELLIEPVGAGFLEKMVATTDPAADKAGSSAGRIFGAAFIKATPGLSTALIRNGEAFVATAESQGAASGEAFSRAYIAGLQSAGVATERVFANPAVTSGAETEGSAAGRAFATGVEGQLPLFGEEGLSAGKAFSRSFIEGTSSLDATANEQGAAAGRAFVSGDLEQLRVGQAEIIAAIREQGAAIIASSEEQGLAAGTAFSRGQRTGLTTGTAENSVLNNLFGNRAQLTSTAEATGFATGSRFISMFSKGIGIGVVAVAAASVVASTKFQSAMELLRTQAGATQGEVDSLSRSVLALAPAVGLGPDKLAEGLYHIESDGYRGAEALDILKIAAQGAAVSGANLDDTSYSLVSTMKALNRDGLQGATQTMGELNAIVGAGDLKFSQLNDALSTGILGTIQTFGVDLRSTGAALDYLTQRGEPAQQSATRLAMGITLLAAPSGKAAGILKDLGLSSQVTGDQLNAVQMALQKSGVTTTKFADDLRQPNGISVAIKDLNDHLKSAGLSADESAATISRAFGGGRTGKAILQLATDTKGIDSAFALINQNANKFGEDFAATTETTSFKWHRLVSELQVDAIHIGDFLRPVVNGLLDGLQKVGSILGPVFGQLGAAISKFAQAAKPAFDAFRDSPIFKPAVIVFFSALLVPLALFTAGLKLLTLVFRDILTPVAKFVSLLVTDFPKAVGEIGHALSDAAGAIGRFFQRLPSDISNWTKDAGKWLIDAGHKAVDGLIHAMSEALPAAFDLGKIIGRGIGRLAADAPKWVSDIFTALQHVDWGHVATAIGNGIIDGLKALWKNKAKIGEVALVIVGGIAAALLAIPVALGAIGLALVGGIIVGIAKGLSGAAGAVGRFFERMWHDSVGFVERLWKDVSGFAERIWHDVSGFFVRLYKDVTGPIGTAVDFISRHWRLLIVIFTGPFGFIIDLIYKFRKGIGDAFEWIWHTVSTIVSALWKTVTSQFQTSVNFVLGIIRFLWNTTVSLFKNSVDFVLGILKFLWNTTFSLFKTSVNFVLGILKFLWDTAFSLFKNSINFLLGILKFLWDTTVSLFKNSVNFVIGIFEGLWHRLVDVANFIWHGIEDPMKKLWDGLKAGFDTVVGWIKTAWDKLSDIFKGPIKFLVQIIYNDAIVPVWNAVADIVGEKGLKVNQIKLDRGGGISGPARGDDRLAMVGGGEHWWTAEEVAKAGGHEKVAAIRSAIVGKPVRVMGDGSERYANGGGTPDLSGINFGALQGVQGVGQAASSNAGGGLSGTLGFVDQQQATRAATAKADAANPSFGSALTHLIRGALSAGTGAVLDAAVSLFSHLVPGNTPWEKSSVGMAHKMVDGIKKWIAGQDAKDQADMFGGADPNALIAFARQYVGKVPYLWGGSEPTGWDCSGYTSWVYNHFGLGAPRTSEAQQAWAKPTNETPGSLVFFGRPATHVGIALGGGQMLDAAHTGTVTRQEGLWPGVSGFGLPPGGLGAGAAGASSSGANVELGRQMAADRGWAGPEFDALNKLWTKESGWNANAVNKGSGAAGIPQALGHGNVFALGDARAQIAWGLNYISSVYGDPERAWAHETSAGWYDQGGYLMPGTTIARNDTGRREKVLDADETAAYESGRRSGGNGAPTVVQHNTYQGVDLSTAHSLTAIQLTRALSKAGV